MNVATIVACGGLGRRLKAEKAEQKLGGVALVDRAIAMATSFGGPLALAVREGQRLAPRGFEQLTDAAAGAGPVSALESGFRFAEANKCSHLLLIACDQPFLPADLASRLGSAIGDKGVAVPVSNGHDQYMAALWKVDSPALTEYIATDGRALWRFAESVGMVRVPWPAEGDDDNFADIDDIAALARAESRFRSRSD